MAISFESISTPWTSLEEYAQGVHRPVFREATAGELPIEGELPDDLRGMFLQIGPNPVFEPGIGHSWLDGDGMVHSVEIRDGGATYRNRVVRTEGLDADIAAGEALAIGSMAGPAQRGNRDKNSANTDVILHGDRLLALWWGSGKPYQLSLPDLSTVGIFDYNGTLGKGLCSHPKLDAVTGELFYIDWARTAPFLTIGRADASGVVTGLAPIDLPGPRVQHDIALSERYVVVFDMALRPHVRSREDTRIGFSFSERQPCRIGLFDRTFTKSQPQWFDVEPCWMWHTMNAWDDGDEVVLTGAPIAHPTRVDADGHEWLGAPLTDGELRMEPHLYEWRLNVKDGTVRERQLDDRLTDFTRVNDSVICRASQYGYAGTFNPSAQEVFIDGAVQYDLVNETSTHIRHGADWYGGEPSFAPAADGLGENEGYVLVFVTDRTTETSELRVFDARRFGDGAIAKVKLPQRVPAGFHTRWLPEAALNAAAR